MSHNHHCSCEHENVKFCKLCRIVHCLGCNFEWTAKVTFNTSTTPYTLGTTYVYPGVSAGVASGGNTLVSSGSGVNLYSTTASAASCGHEEKK